MKQTRVDTAYPLSILFKRMSYLGEKHIKELHQLLRYLKGTQDYGVTLVGQKRHKIKGYRNTSYANCDSTAKSVIGWVTTVGGTALC